MKTRHLHNSSCHYNHSSHASHTTFRVEQLPMLTATSAIWRLPIPPAPRFPLSRGVAKSGAAVNLVVWGNGTNGTRGTAYISYTANGKRSSIKNINIHCLSCHNSANAAFTPFAANSTDQYSPEARLSTPKAKTSILSRYSSTRVVPWSSITIHLQPAVYQGLVPINKAEQARHFPPTAMLLKTRCLNLVSYSQRTG